MLNVKKTMRFGVLKYSKRKSLSPVMHRYLMKSLGIEGEYDSHSVPPEELERFVIKSRTNSFDGYNVTTPHKETIVQHMDRLTPEAEAIGALNCVAVRNGKSIGHNTDMIGFKKALDSLGIEIRNSGVLLFGAGGAARAIVYSLYEMGVSTVFVRNRTKSHADSLSDILSDPNKKSLVVLNDSDPLPTDVKLAVNALSHGVFQPEELTGLDNLRFFYDLNYGTGLSGSSFTGDNIRYSDGLSMLVYQGIESLKFWLDRDIPDEGLAISTIRKLERTIRNG